MVLESASGHDGPTASSGSGENNKNSSTSRSGVPPSTSWKETESSSELVVTGTTGGRTDTVNAIGKQFGDVFNIAGCTVNIYGDDIRLKEMIKACKTASTMEEKTKTDTVNNEPLGVEKSEGKVQFDEMTGVDTEDMSTTPTATESMIGLTSVFAQVCEIIVQSFPKITKPTIHGVTSVSGKGPPEEQNNLDMDETTEAGWVVITSRNTNEKETSNISEDGPGVAGKIVKLRISGPSTNRPGQSSDERLDPTLSYILKLRCSRV